MIFLCQVFCIQAGSELLFSTNMYHYVCRKGVTGKHASLESKGGGSKTESANSLIPPLQMSPDLVCVKKNRMSSFSIFSIQLCPLLLDLVHKHAFVAENEHASQPRRRELSNQKAAFYQDK